MFCRKLTLSKASELCEMIKNKRSKKKSSIEREFEVLHKSMFNDTVYLIDRCAKCGLYVCRLTCDISKVFGLPNRYMDREYIPLFFSKYESTFLESGYNFQLLGDHTILITWFPNESQGK